MLAATPRTAWIMARTYCITTKAGSACVSLGGVGGGDGAFCALEGHGQLGREARSAFLDAGQLKLRCTHRAS